MKTRIFSRALTHLLDVLPHALRKGGSVLRAEVGTKREQYHVKIDCWSELSGGRGLPVFSRPRQTYTGRAHGIPLWPQNGFRMIMVEDRPIACRGRRSGGLRCAMC